MNTRIVIIEDNFPFAIELEMHLKSWGYEVIDIQDNGEDAIAVITEENPDLILMDISIIGPYNGVDVAKKIKGLDIPIIYMTGDKSRTNYQNAKTTTGISYLVKPFDMLTLKGVIEFYFKRQAEPQEKPHQSPSNSNELFVRKNKELVKIASDSVDWISSTGNYCIISADGKKYIVRKSMKNTMSLLPKGDFVKIHKSYSIRIKSVSGIFLSENKVRVGEDMLPLGRNYRKKIVDLIKHIQ